MFTIILNWFKKNAALLLGGLAIFVMFACFVSGCNYHKNRFPCTSTNDTIVTTNDNKYKIIDSLQSVIDSLMSLPPEIRYKWLPQDTLFTPPDTFFKDVDTNAILKNHYSVFRYKWHKLDTGLLEFDLWTTVTRNMPIKYELDYQILQPKETIINTQDNSVNYSKYVYAGIDIPFYNAEYSEVSLLVAFKKGYLGAGYAPFQKGFSLKTGIKLFTWE